MFMINEDLILDSLIDWNLWGNFNESLKERECKPKLPRSRVIQIIKGVRRSGKSRITYLLSKNYNEKESLIINFEDPRLKDLNANDIIQIINLYERKISHTGPPKLLILDEVQNIKGWEKIARLYCEAKNVKIIITGSSSKLMSEEYASVLTGRHLDFEVFPLSFREALTWRNTKLSELEIHKNKIKILKILDEFLNFGSFPEVFLTKNKAEKLDIVKRFRVREIEKIEHLSKNYLANIASLHSLNKLKKVVRLSLDSIERFSKYFEIARLFFFIPKFGYSIKQQILNPKKVYTIDVGFFNAIGFRFSQNLGKILENTVAIELLRRKSYSHKNWSIYYWKDYQQREVDFVIKEGVKVKQLIQVTYASDKEEVEKREIRALLKASEDLKCKNLLVITNNYEGEEIVNKKKIKFIPLWRWLLHPLRC